MIDDKKIGEAARNYCNNRYPASQDAPFIAEGFRHGAKWAVNEFLKDLWHPADEEPEKFRIILYTGGSINTADTIMLIRNNNWNIKVYLLKIKKWCYIDDLFQNEGCKQ